MEKPTDKARQMRREIVSWVATFVVAFAIWFGVRTFLFQFIRVDGSSMRDTLLDNEYMFVEHLSYWFGAPRAGDIVICRFPGEDDDYVKRVVGVPGDTLEIRAGIVYRNGEAVEEPYVAYPQAYEDMPAETLGEDEYLVFGDNRANSTDGRILGPLRGENIKGHVLAIVWPLDRIHGVASST